MSNLKKPFGNIIYFGIFCIDEHRSVWPMCSSVTGIPLFFTREKDAEDAMKIIAINHTIEKGEPFPPYCVLQVKVDIIDVAVK